MCGGAEYIVPEWLVRRERDSLPGFSGLLSVFDREAGWSHSLRPCAQLFGGRALRNSFVLHAPPATPADVHSRVTDGAPTPPAPLDTLAAVARAVLGRLCVALWPHGVEAVVFEVSSPAGVARLGNPSTDFGHAGAIATAFHSGARRTHAVADTPSHVRRCGCECVCPLVAAGDAAAAMAPSTVPSALVGSAATGEAVTVLPYTPADSRSWQADCVVVCDMYLRQGGTFRHG